MEPEVELPEVLQSTLDPAAVLDMARQIDAHATVHEVLRKGAPQTHTPTGDTNLWDAVNSLLSCQCRGIQVRYEFEGETWVDTLMRTPDGVRVVRMRQPHFSSCDQS